MKFPLYIIDGVYSTRNVHNTHSQEELLKIVCRESKGTLDVLKHKNYINQYYAGYETLPLPGFIRYYNINQPIYHINNIVNMLHFHTQEEFDNFLLLYNL